MQSLQYFHFRYLLFAALGVLLLISSAEAVPAHYRRNTEESSDAPKSNLHKRAPVTHPSAAHAITLFHGTALQAHVDSIHQHGMQLSATRQVGDFNSNTVGGTAGGAYFTDSLAAAAQFACFGDHRSSPATVHVLEFTWNPAGLHVHEFTGETAEWRNLMTANSGQHADKVAAAQLMHNNDMIAGPMNAGPADSKLTKDFWQYAIIKQHAIDTGLHYVTTHSNIQCHKVAKLSATGYMQGQKANPKFTPFVNNLESTKTSCLDCVIM
jgi:hypothetical protein